MQKYQLQCTELELGECCAGRPLNCVMIHSDNCQNYRSLGSTFSGVCMHILTHIFPVHGIYIMIEKWEHLVFFEEISVVCHNIRQPVNMIIA